ncbi:biopolymer transporter Tol [Kineococcus sp. NPDC059986]|uniref:TolB family protein n=1 Tax=Kineococcus sp. NPDC059986 TaxID=3155538 RepID=UPI00345090B0
MPRHLAPSQRCRILLGGPDRATPVVLFETAELLLEAPNWSLDGTSLLLNGDGRLWRLDVDDTGAGVHPVRFEGLPPVNNDHVLHPDGRHVLMSADDGHVYRGELTGGPVERITRDDGFWHFLHGVSPDGLRIAYVEIGSFEEPGRLVVQPVGGAPQVLDTGDGHLDGPEWTPDGRWILLNTEAFGATAGHAQLARVPDGGGPLERLVVSDTVDWFPHVSPDGRCGTYLSFPAGTVGHPADLDVVVHVVAADDWTTSVQRYPVQGGQGTTNVNGWAPDSARFAFVDYPTG